MHASVRYRNSVAIMVTGRMALYLALYKHEMKGGLGGSVREGGGSGRDTYLHPVWGRSLTRIRGRVDR